MSFETLAGFIAPSRFVERPIDLLVLSACETAASDDQSALGLAGAAVRSGASSALGTLWPISDAETSTLISSFYEQLGAAGTTKAEALRRAQVAALHDPKRGHPFYWSAFLMVSSWL
ncbi:MAG: CHAT domain-containing protein [Deltaproteobacteria bacterium]|nr:CHAT domain-containing protein [Deltaproteobacteria bacterium]